MTASKLRLLKLHRVSFGLSQECIRELADSAELIQCDAEHQLIKSGEVIESIYLVVKGRLRLYVHDPAGNLMLQRFVSRGDQLGGLGAALAEPVPMNAIAHEPSTLLKIPYRRCQEITGRYDDFRSNLTRLIAGSARDAVLGNKVHPRPRLILLYHATDATRELTVRLAARLLELGESPCVLHDSEDWKGNNGIRHRCLVDNGQYLEADPLLDQISKWQDSSRILVEVVGNSIKPAELKSLANGCDSLFWCMTPDDGSDPTARLSHLCKAIPGLKEKTNLAWLLGSQHEVAPDRSESGLGVAHEFKLSFSAPQPKQGPLLQNGLERIVHFLRGIQIGVALGGGAARGMAHLGVLKALEENGIIVDRIAGTSAGAMTGTLYASGMDVAYSVQCFVHDLKPNWIFRWLPRGDQWYLVYKYRRGQFDPMLRRYLKTTRLEQLAVPMHTVTVDLVGGKAVTRESGDAVDAILESINLPVLSLPINRNGQSLVDGGLVNNIPADVLVSKGCNFIIAVSVTAKLEHEFAKNRPDTPTSRMRSASTLQTILRSFLVQSTNLNSVGVEPSDYVIQPNVTQFELTEFTRTDELAAAGEQATVNSISSIKGLLRQMDSKLFG